MAKLKYRNKLAEMPSYDVVERDWNIKVNANESGMNLPPLVEERVMSRLSRVAFNRYPNEDLEMLMEAIGRNFGLGVENVLIGNGSSEIIEKIFYCFGGRGRKIVFPQPSFSMYHIYAKAAEAEAVPVSLSEKDYSLDVKEFVNVVNDNKAALCVICNPNNPTGSFTSLEDIEYIASHTSCAFLVDEAYIEFNGQTAIGLMKKYPNMIIARTFSKAYGLAACRCGYMLAAAPLTAMIAKSMMPYHMNVLTLVTADTVFQMRDEFIPRIQMAIAERKRMEGQYGTLKGFQVFPSNTNFIFVKYDKAVELNEYLESRGIGIRSFGKAPLLENALRISMGNRDENDAVFKAVKAFVEEQN